MTPSWVPYTGLVLSVIVFVWNLALTWLRWPRIGVVVRQHVRVSDTYEDTAKLVVINRGAEAVTIANIGVETKTRTHGIDYEHLDLQNLTKPEGPGLPAKLDGHGCLVWTFSSEQLKTTFPVGTEYFAYADRYKALWNFPFATRIPRNIGTRWFLDRYAFSPIRRKYSPRPTTRNGPP